MSAFNTVIAGYKSLKISKWDRPQIVALQQQRLRSVLKHAVTHSEFYRDLYRGIDIENCQLQDLPTVTKSAMMDNYDRLVTDKRLKLGEIRNWLSLQNNQGNYYLDEFAPFLTAGSTGESALMVYSRSAMNQLQSTIQLRLPLDRQISIYHQAQAAASYLMGAKARLAVLGVPRGNLFGLAGNPPSIQRLAVTRKLISLFDPLDRVVEQLNEFQPDRMVSNTFFLAILAQEQLAGRLHLEFNHPMSFVAGTAEPLTEHTQRLALKAWNKRIQDCYGTVETWFIATSCSHFHRLHLMSDLYILEIVDRNCRAVPDGQFGEKVLVTSLFNFVQPLIRYEVEDITGYADQSCECGLPFPTLMPIQGRASEVFYFEKPRGGYEIFHPYRFSIPLFYEFDLRQYQIVQTARNELTFFYVLQNPEFKDEQTLKHKLEEALRQGIIESRVTLRLKRVDAIARDERSGKYKPYRTMGAPPDLGP